MVNLLSAIMTKTTGSNLSSDVGGRIYLDQAPAETEFPYIVFLIVSGVPDKTFTEYYTDTLIQFSLFSSSAGATEITTMLTDLKALFDECSFTITGSKLVWMKFQNLTTMIEDITTPSGTATVKHWACDFAILTSLN